LWEPDGAERGYGRDREVRLVTLGGAFGSRERIGVQSVVVADVAKCWVRLCAALSMTIGRITGSERNSAEATRAEVRVQGGAFGNGGGRLVQSVLSCSIDGPVRSSGSAAFVRLHVRRVCSGRPSGLLGRDLSLAERNVLV